MLNGDPESTVYSALMGNEPLPIASLSENLFLVPASLQLSMAELELASAMARERILSELLEPVKGEFEYVLIDCPPSLGLLTLNALTASTDIESSCDWDFDNTLGEYETGAWRGKSAA